MRKDVLRTSYVCVRPPPSAEHVACSIGVGVQHGQRLIGTALKIGKASVRNGKSNTIRRSYRRVHPIGTFIAMSGELEDVDHGTSSSVSQEEVASQSAPVEATAVSTMSDAHPLNSKIVAKCPLQIRYLYIPYISSVSTKDMTFDLRIDIDLLWNATPADKQSFQMSKSSYTPSYVPNLVFQNSKTVDITQVPLESGSPFSIQNDKNFVRLKVVGSFLNHFDVARFPFDVQRLCMNISISFKNAEEVQFVFEKEGADVLYVLTENNAIADWSIFGCDFESKIGSDGFSSLNVVIGIRRLSTYVVWKHFFPCVLITFASFLNFYLEAHSDRMSYLVTLMLTLVAFQFAVTDMLPFNPAPTFTDFIFMTSFGFVALLLFRAGMAPDSANYNSDIFFYSACVLFAGFCLFYTLIATYFFFNNNRRCSDKSFLLYSDPNKSNITHKSKGLWSALSK